MMEMTPSPARVEERSPGAERRMVLRVLQYWRQVSGDRIFPRSGDIAPADIPDMWPCCYLIDVASAPADPIIEYAGPDSSEGVEGDIAGRSISRVPSDTLLAKATSYLDQVVAKAVPISMGGEFEDGTGTKILYRSILLPLSDDGRSVNRVLGAANYRKISAI